jgi:hypothetical protein
MKRAEEGRSFLRSKGFSAIYQLISVTMSMSTAVS